jgi:hypothetical protein
MKEYLLREVFRQRYALDVRDANRVSNLIYYIYGGKKLPDEERRKWIELGVLEDGKVATFPLFVNGNVLHPAMFLFLLLVWYGDVDFRKIRGKNI